MEKTRNKDARYKNKRKRKTLILKDSILIVLSSKLIPAIVDKTKGYAASDKPLLLAALTAITNNTLSGSSQVVVYHALNNKIKVTQTVKR